MFVYIYIYICIVSNLSLYKYSVNVLMGKEKEYLFMLVGNVFDVRQPRRMVHIHSSYSYIRCGAYGLNFQDHFNSGDAKLPPRFCLIGP